MVTLEQLKAIMPRMQRESTLASSYIQPLNKAMDEAGIATPAREAAFLAQVAHESYEFKYMSEEWDPQKVPAQLHYEPPYHLAAKLGNVKKGDGFKYRGAGPLQLTGRANFRTYGQALGLDLEANPDLARAFPVGMRIAALYWTRHNLNALADAGDFEGITRAINGGLNGLAQRQAYWETAKRVLGS